MTELKIAPQPMRNRNGTESNGYFGSSNHVEDEWLNEPDWRPHFDLFAGAGRLPASLKVWILFSAVKIFIKKKIIRLRRFLHGIKDRLTA